MKISFLSFVAITMFISCVSDESDEPKVLVDDELVVYFDRFALEANARGMDIDWEEEQVSANLTKIDTDAVGQCLTYTGGLRKINIDEDYWRKSDVIDREFLIFHELGHCILGRAHADDANLNGTCVSIMSSGEEFCRKDYDMRTREKYIDELFSGS